MAVPSGAKKPTDRKTKSNREWAECFTFTHDETEYSFKPTYEHLTPGFLRKNRRRDDMDAFWTMVEELADEETLDVIDNMSRARFQSLVREFFEYMEADSGE